MIKVQSMENTDSNPNSYKVALFTDTKAEVATTALSDIVGFPANGTIEMGSTCMSAEGDFAFMKSDGTWNWL